MGAEPIIFYQKKERNTATKPNQGCIGFLNQSHKHLIKKNKNVIITLQEIHKYLHFFSGFPITISTIVLPPGELVKRLWYPSRLA